MKIIHSMENIHSILKLYKSFILRVEECRKTRVLITRLIKKIQQDKTQPNEIRKVLQIVTVIVQRLDKIVSNNEKDHETIIALLLKSNNNIQTINTGGGKAELNEKKGER